MRDRLLGSFYYFGIKYKVIYLLLIWNFSGHLCQLRCLVIYTYIVHNIKYVGGHFLRLSAHIPAHSETILFITLILYGPLFCLICWTTEQRSRSLYVLFTYCSGQLRVLFTIKKNVFVGTIHTYLTKQTYTDLNIMPMPERITWFYFHISFPPCNIDKYYTYFDPPRRHLVPVHILYLRHLCWANMHNKILYILNCMFATQMSYINNIIL